MLNGKEDETVGVRLEERLRSKESFGFGGPVLRWWFERGGRSGGFRCILLHILSFLHILIEQRRRPSRRDAVVTNVTISLRLKMGPVLATEGELRQTASHTASQQCVEANGAGAVASNDGKQMSDGVFL